MPTRPAEDDLPGSAASPAVSLAGGPPVINGSDLPAGGLVDHLVAVHTNAQHRSMERHRLSLLHPVPLDLGDARLPRLILRTTLPSVVGLSMVGLHQVVNALFVGGAGTAAVVAISMTFPVALLTAALAEGVAIGAASRISRMLGANRQHEADQAAALALGYGLMLASAATAGLVLGAEPIVAALGTPAVAAEETTLYLRLLALGYAPLMLQIVCDFVAIAEGNARFSMLTLIGGFALNILLDAVLILGAGLGVAGAAIATALSSLAAVGAYAWYFRRRIGRVRPRLGLLRPDWAALRDMAGIGVSAAGFSIFSALAFVLLYRAASGYGAAAVAGIGIAQRIYSGGMRPIAGFCMGVQPVLGFAWGAGDARRVARTLCITILVACGFALAYGAVMVLASGAIAAWFARDADTLATARTATAVLHAPFVLLGLHLAVLTLLQATGRARLSLLLTLAPQGYFLIPAVVLLPRGWGLDGLVAAQPVALVLSSLLAAGIGAWAIARPGLRDA